jgi:hypothetical protein
MEDDGEGLGKRNSRTREDASTANIRRAVQSASNPEVEDWTSQPFRATFLHL